MVPGPAGPKPYKFIGFGDFHGRKPYRFIRFGDLQGPKPYRFIGFGVGNHCWPPSGLGGATGVCEIKAVLANLSISLRTPAPLFQCWRACTNKSRVLREGGAEEGNIETGGDGASQKTREGESM